MHIVPFNLLTMTPEIGAIHPIYRLGKVLACLRSPRQEVDGDPVQGGVAKCGAELLPAG